MSDTPLPPLKPIDEDWDVIPNTNHRLFRPSEVAHLEKPVDWIWEGYLARGYVTLLTGQWKVGKSTLLGALLARLGAGGELAGRAVRPGHAVVLSEEEAGPWVRRINAHRIPDAASILFNPHRVKPVDREWGLLIDGLIRRRRERPTDLVVFDTLAGLLPGNRETSGAAMTEALRPVRELAASGTAVLLIHHPRKGAVADGQAARGTGVLPATADTLLEYKWAGPPTSENRRRRLQAWSRHAGAPGEVLLELDAAGTGYAILPPWAAELADGSGRTAAELVRAHPGKTVGELYDLWPPDMRPARRTVRQRLADLFAGGWLTRTGAGIGVDPFRYTWAGDGAEEPAADVPASYAA